MATIKKKSKKSTIIIVSVVLAVVIIGAVAAGIAIKNKVPEVKLTTISTSDIHESVSATGTVASGSSKEYKVDAVATVKEVFVKPGDEVKEGDRLATFDTSTLNGEISKLQATYNNARASYNEAVKDQKDANAKIRAVEKQITALENQLENLPDTVPVVTTRRPSPTVTVPSTEDTSSSEEDTSREPIITIPSTSETEPVSYPATMEGLVDALTDLVNTINRVAADIESTNALIQIVMETIVEEINNGNLSSDAIAEKVAEAVTKAIQDGIVDVIESGAAADMIEAAVKAVDWKGVASAIMNSNSAQGASLELQITALTAQKELYGIMASDSTVKAKKEVMSTAKSALDTLKETSNELEAGWVATFDGTITACDLVPGTQASIISGGITLENMDSMVVTVSLNEYDIHKIKVGMPAKITTAYGSYTGEVTAKAPTATGGSSGSILDSVGSMAGISGLSSLTASGAGVDVQVRIDNPDENIIIGFDADVEIEAGSYIGITVVPIESIILEKTGTYVYLYNEEKKEVTKTPIETGAVSDTYYQVTSGISVGDQIVSAPSTEFKEDTFNVKIAK